ncbi:MAG: glycoside hydrolase family 9 protein [Planctomycetes bacterium]|nr:glycoside hydrolase family 9 protein [Planctomycetota bacterium]
MRVLSLRLPALLALLLVAGAGAHAADLRGVSPVTDTILMVRLNEGHIDQGLSEKDAKPYITKLDTKAAAQPERYGILSEDDSRFKSEQHPVKVGRKTKASDTLSLFTPDKFVLDHWIYLVLPQALQRGCTYTLRIEGLASEPQTCTFLFHENALHSETVHVTQIGFTPEAPKFAYLSHWMGDLGGLNLDAYADKPFLLVRVSDGEAVFTGKVAKRKDLKTGAPQTASNLDGTPYNGSKKKADPKNFTEADVWQCDFSAFKDPGEYRVAVEGIGCSFPFAIDADVYRKAYCTASRGLFFQRAGIEKEVEPGLNYPRDHHPDDGLNAFEYDKNWRWIDRPDHNAKITPTGSLKVWGWYHDAGDWDGYPGHVLVPYSLLLLYDLAPEKFADGQVGNRYKSNSDGTWVEEGKNGLPDLLDEASWLIQFYRRARAVGMQTGVTTGGVPGGHRGVDSCAGEASWKDKRALKFSAEDPATTYQYAACAAWLAACLDKAAKGAHSDSAEWIKEAKAAYAWAKANMREGDEGKVAGQRMLAALCLYRATKEASFHEQFAADIKKDVSMQKGEEGWSAPNGWELAAGIYALLPADFPGLDKDLQKTLQTKAVAAADSEFVHTASERGFRLGFDWSKMHQLGTFSTPMLFLPAIAYKISGEKKFLDVMHTTAAYCLGGNPMNMVWMTGLGQRAVKYPFHPDSWALIDYNSMVYDNEILPGYVPFGSCESGDIFGPGYHFSGDEDFSRASAYPDVDTWPLSETRFENRYSIWGGEFTVVQNMAPSVFAYGFLSGNAGKPPAAHTRPGVAIAFPSDKDVFKVGADVSVRVKTTPGVRRVEFYRNEHYLGESANPPFAFTWRNAPQGEWLLTAKAFDEAGQTSKPNDPAFKVDVKVRVDTGTPAVAAEKVEILNAPPQAFKADTVWGLTASFTPLAASSQEVVWSSSDAKVAAVNSLGQVTAKAPGRAVITLKAKDGGRAAECAIQVAAGQSKP